MMENINIKWILVNKASGKYYASLNCEKEPRCGDPENIEWVEWNKTLPEDIDMSSYVYSGGELIKE